MKTQIISFTILFLLSGLVIAHDGDHGDYVKNSYGEVWKNSFGECWQSRFDEIDEFLPECGHIHNTPEPVVMKKAPPPPKPIIIAKVVPFELDKTFLFDFDGFKMSEKSKHEIVKEINTVKNIKSVDHVSVEGHTDSVGSATYNQKLSEKRAKVVAKFVANILNVDLKSINVKSYGESKPIASNKTKVGRALNRRAVIHVEGTKTEFEKKMSAFEDSMYQLENNKYFK